MTGDTSPQLARAIESWEVLQQRQSGATFELDGQGLQIADVVAAAYYDCVPKLSDQEEVLQGVQDSVDVLAHHLTSGFYIYGVNTGFGGSADSRTAEVVSLQAALMQLTQAGVLTSAATHEVRSGQRDQDFRRGSGHAMPAPWVRATMVVRCNATVRGHSAVSLPILQAVMRLLENRITPVVPLRGSVSASGDLMPLAYIAGAIEGSPDIYVEMSRANRTVLPARDALQLQGIDAVRLGPKEGLGLVNGTASSAALGALVMYEVHHLSVLVQALTGMAVEALQGSAESFHPFIAAVRPHSGQVECARNILSFLRGSYLARDVREPKDRRREDLIQDRYALRSAPQWIGPQLEDLLLADRQISVELNSSCDNPLVNAASGDILYGCNFQAAAVTSAMEKARLSLQMFGRLIFCQLTEMVNPSLSGGLPANLAADDPSLSFTMKGVDISMAAYMAELSYLANPLSSHVQAAEMHNQSINSMAFASARMSMEATDILSLMCANSLYACCQALDLRVLHCIFLSKAQEALRTLTVRHFSPGLDAAQLDGLLASLEAHIAPNWNSTSKSDLQERCQKLITSLLPLGLEALSSSNGSVVTLTAWKYDAITVISDTWNTISEQFSKHQDTDRYLGAASKVLYRFVRNELAVPFHQGFVEHPTVNNNSLDGRPKRTVGGWISIVYEAIQDGRLYAPLMRFAKEHVADVDGAERNGNGVSQPVYGGEDAVGE